MQCTRCGQENGQEDRFCRRCGMPLTEGAVSGEKTKGLYRKATDGTAYRLRMTRVSLVALIVAAVNALLVLFVPYTRFLVDHGSTYKNFYLYLFQGEMKGFSAVYKNSSFSKTGAVYSPPEFRAILGILLLACLAVIIFSALAERYKACKIASAVFAGLNYVGGQIASTAPFRFDCEVYPFVGVYLPTVLAIGLLVYLLIKVKKRVAQPEKQNVESTNDT